MLVDVSQISVATTLLGENLSLPVAIAPTGMAGLFARDGEVQGARAAQAAGTRLCLSTMSICTIEDVARRPRSRSGTSSTCSATAASANR